jgi:hypothetical protein
MEQGRSGRMPRVKTLRNQDGTLFGLIILEYIYDNHPPGSKSPTAHWVQQHARKLRSSQLSRVQETLRFLEQRGWLEHAESTSGTSYSLTPEGMNFWAKVGKQALDGFFPMYRR